MRWDGSAVLVTGASRGIGEAIARAAAARGARVALLARAKADLERVLAACGGAGVVLPCDLTDRGAVEEAVAAAERALGPLDVVVNNAGAGAYGAVADTDVETFERLVRLNYFGAVYATKAALPAMLARGDGHIVNVASINARIGAPLEAAYAASKFALAGFTEALAFELRPKGIGVSLVNPGPVATPFFEARGVPYKRAFPRPMPPERIADAVLRAVDRGTAESFIPAWLRMPAVLKAVAPPLFRIGTARIFPGDLR